MKIRFRNAIATFLYLIVQSHVYAQIAPIKYYDDSYYLPRLDSLRASAIATVEPQGDQLETAVLIALSQYPELKGNTIKIKYKKSVKYPITASWNAGNIFKFRKKHIYVLLLHPDAFVTKQNLNKQVGVIGHELSHFIYYRERPGINMAWWGLKYVTSKKFRQKFEREADFTTADHLFGWQMLETSFYTTRKEILQHMKQSELYTEVR